MNNNPIIKTYIEEALRTNGFGVLTTESDGQPHASFVAITPVEGFQQLIFATYRSTRKYDNLKNNGKVAILFENRSTKSANQPDIYVITAFGNAEEIKNDEFEVAMQLHVSKHPEQSSFLLSKDCTIFRIKVNDYQVVLGIDDVKWWKINNET